MAQSNFYTTAKPEAAIVIKKHKMGADLVSITVQSGSYPIPLLEQKIRNLGQILNGNSRGIAITKTAENYVQASFAVNGLINESDPRLNLVALAQAFGTGERRFKQFSVFFEEIIPDKSVPARWFPEDGSWKLEAVASRVPFGIDFRVEVSTQNPKEIYLPGPTEAKKDQRKIDKKSQPDFVLIGAVSVGALAFGLLVYSALTRPKSR
jgi:hypothetical protein